MEKKVNYHLETILWLDKQIDEVNAKAALIGDLLLEETDPAVIEKYDLKLAELEKQLDNINNKLDTEKRLIKNQQN